LFAPPAQYQPGFKSEGMNNTQADFDNGLNISMGFADSAVTQQGVLHIETVAATPPRDVRSSGKFSFLKFYFLSLHHFMFRSFVVVIQTRRFGLPFL
jgi:hypothetical protein